eukprot:TRINITY_DN284_c0_g1_i5.p2 TRINITY_DN284_c0_g1~~TRINITY_DN284_c0_g1_i5.p2  ORF type:complete len:149 (+),score=42.16 TRINITY_DN284_c0_g1_i5:64-510(+)
MCIRDRLKQDMVKTYELRTKDEKALVEELGKLKAELAKARIGKVSAAATQVKASKIKVLRKDIARLLTIINEKRRDASALAFKKKKYKPLDQRAKATRAFRRKLTPFQKSRKTLRTLKRLNSNPLRKFALEAQIQDFFTIQYLSLIHI